MYTDDNAEKCLSHPRTHFLLFGFWHVTPHCLSVFFLIEVTVFTVIKLSFYLFLFLYVRFLHYITAFCMRLRHF